MKYLVIGWDSDQQQATFDFVEADHETEAQIVVAGAREDLHDCWERVTAYTAKELYETALHLADSSKLPRTAAALRKGLK